MTEWAKNATKNGQKNATKHVSPFTVIKMSNSDQSHK